MTAPDKTKRPGGHPSVSVESSGEEINEDSLQDRRERCLLGCSPGCSYVSCVLPRTRVEFDEAVEAVLTWAVEQ